MRTPRGRTPASRPGKPEAVNRIGTIECMWGVQYNCWFDDREKARAWLSAMSYQDGYIRGGIDTLRDDKGMWRAYAIFATDPGPEFVRTETQFRCMLVGRDADAARKIRGGA